MTKQCFFFFFFWENNKAVLIYKKGKYFDPLNHKIVRYFTHIGRNYKKN